MFSLDSMGRGGDGVSYLTKGKRDWGWEARIMSQAGIVLFKLGCILNLTQQKWAPSISTTNLEKNPSLLMMPIFSCSCFSGVKATCCSALVVQLPVDVTDADRETLGSPEAPFPRRGCFPSLGTQLWETAPKLTYSHQRKESRVYRSPFLTCFLFSREENI